MALETGGNSLVYVGNYMGNFEVRVKPGTPGSIEREKKGGDKISVLNYKALSGHITDIKKDVSEKNGIKMVSLKIFIDDYATDASGEEVLTHYCLTFPYNSNLVTAFYHMVEDIDFSLPVRFSSNHGKDDKGKEKTSLFISQEGVNLKWRYTKKWSEANPDAPKKPEWKQIVVKGEPVWDNTEEIRFFEAILKEKILPGLRAKKSTSDAVKAPPVGSSIPNNIDLPSGESLVENDSWIPSAEPTDQNVGQPPSDDLPF